MEPTRRDVIRIGNGAGFWGDNVDAPVRLAESATLDVLTLEYLAELTLAILAHLRSKNPDAGFVTDFPDAAGAAGPRSPRAVGISRRDQRRRPESAPPAPGPARAGSSRRRRSASSRVTTS